MGCVSSKLLATTDLDQGILAYGNKASGNGPNHIVSLTSSTYGVLNLDPLEPKGKQEEEERGEEEATTKEWRRSPPTLILPPSKKRVSKEAAPEVINAWELMKDLSDETPAWSPIKKPTKSHVPMHLLSAAKALMSPKKPKKRSEGKENTPLRQGSERLERSDLDSSRVLRPFSPLEKAKWAGPVSVISKRSTPNSARSGRDSGVSAARQSLSPLFDPELLASFEKEHCEEGEEIKKMIAASKPRNRKAHDSGMLLQSYKQMCPPGGESKVVLYTTTLRGIRKTFEDCNAVRSVIGSHDVQIVERDISMDSGYKEELRLLMGTKEVKVPLMFVKGRLIGGTEEVLRLEEEAKLGLLLEGIPSAEMWCEGCGGVRFVMCMECSGSCKVLDEEQKKTVRCEKCNENGLIHCPKCC